jgi:hypothetical protein
VPFAFEGTDEDGPSLYEYRPARARLHEEQHRRLAVADARNAIRPAEEPAAAILRGRSGLAETATTPLPLDPAAMPT